MNILNFDIGQFIYQYFVHPIIYGDGYNVVNTVTYAIILGISLFAILWIMKRLEISIDQRLVIATFPFIIMGASLRVIEDVKLLDPPLSYMFITPFVYFLAFTVTATALLACIAMEHRGKEGNNSRPFLRTALACIAGLWAIMSIIFAVSFAGLIVYGGTAYTDSGLWTGIGSVVAVLAALIIAVTAISMLACYILERRGVAGDYSKPYFWLGVMSIFIILGLLATKPVNSWWWAPVVIFSLAFTFTGVIYLIGRYFKLGFLTNGLNVAILAAHMFDASSTFTAIDIVTGFAEKHVVPVFFISLTNTAFVMYALKLAVFIPVIYVIEKYFKDDPQMYYAIKFVLLVLGFGPGIRNTLELTFI